MIELLSDARRPLVRARHRVYSACRRQRAIRSTRPFVLIVILAAIGLGSPAEAQDTAPALRERLQPLVGEAKTRAEAIASAGETTLPEGAPFVVRFRGNIKDLEPAAPVTILGRPVGTVREVDLTFSSAEGSFEALVVFDIVPRRVTVDGQTPDTNDALYDAAEAMVAKGLRAQVAGALVGRPHLELAMKSDAQPAGLRRDGRYPEIPAGTSQAERLRIAADELILRIAELPIERLAEESEETIVAVRKLLTSPEIRETLASVQAAAKDLRVISSSIESRTDKVFNNLIKASDAARQAAEQATRTIAALDGTVGAKSLIWGDLERLLSELTGVLRSLRQFTEYLERHPEAIIQGKSGDG